ncbi:MAG: type II toxin-antitoxin system VapC family toxin [Egibacteraceae bacterium]
MSADHALYLDSSALVKLVVAEAESDALRSFLQAWPIRVSCALARTEVQRALRGQGPQVLLRARALLARTHLLHLDDLLLDVAAALDPLGLRSLDAIHLAAAQSLGEALGAVVTYDQRMAEAAKLFGLAVEAPA